MKTIALALVALVAGCSGGSKDPAPADPPRYALTVSKGGTGNGQVESAPVGISCGSDCSEVYGSGTVVTLTATAGAGSTFTGWSGGGCTGADTCVVTVTSETSVTAMFTLSQHTLTVARAGTGTGAVTSAPAGIDCGAECSEVYAWGTAVTLTAVPAVGSTFTGWSGGGCTGTGPCTVNVTAETAVSATFTLSQHTLTVTRAGTGAGTVISAPAGISCGADCSEVYAFGTAVTLTAMPAPGSAFTGWSGGGCTGTGACTVNVAAATLVTAMFTLSRHPLTVAKAGTGGGTVTSAPAGVVCGADCSEVYAWGTAVTLTAVPAPGSTFTGWSGGGCTGTGTCTVTVTATTSVTAVFTLRGVMYTIRDGGDLLERMDPDSYALTSVGALGVEYEFGDCAWNPRTNQLYAVDGRGAKALYRVDPGTGAATLVGTHGLTDLFAIGYHPPTNAIYGIAANRNLYSLSQVTGAATLVGATGIPVYGVDGLSWDPFRARFVAATAGSTSLYAIDVSTGAASSLASPSTFINNHGMTYDPSIDRHVAVDYSGNVFRLAPASAFAVTTAATGLGAHTCVAFRPMGPEIGFPNAFSGGSSHGPNYLLGAQINVPFASTLQRFGIIAKAAGPQVKLALYRESGGNPSTLVAQVGPVALTGGAQEIAATPVLLTAGNYWLMAVYDGTASLGQDGNQTTMVKYVSHPFADALPSTFPAPTTYTGSNSNYYIVVSP